MPDGQQRPSIFFPADTSNRTELMIGVNYRVLPIELAPHTSDECSIADGIDLGYARSI